MSPKEKSQQLIKTFGVNIALDVVTEITKALEDYDNLTENYLKEEFGINYFSSELQNMDSDFRYWVKVKNEIKKLRLK